MTVRHMLPEFPDLAYTTLLTTLDRLYRKGLLTRLKTDRAFAYEPRFSREQLLGELVSNHVGNLWATSSVNTAILCTLVQCVGRRDAAMLDELEGLVRAERLRLHKDGK